jgi:hypothetical protein
MSVFALNGRDCWESWCSRHTALGGHRARRLGRLPIPDAVPRECHRSGGPVLISTLYDTLVWKDERGIIPWLAEEVF